MLGKLTLVDINTYLHLSHLLILLKFNVLILFIAETELLCHIELFVSKKFVARTGKKLNTPATTYLPTLSSLIKCEHCTLKTNNSSLNI